VAVLGMLKGLPLAYQRDLQEDKTPLFGSVAALEASLGVLAGLVDSMSVDTERMRAATADGHITATAVADALVRRGLPFRVAHHVVGALVARADADGQTLEAVPTGALLELLEAADDPDATRLAADPAIGDAVRAAATLDAALASCDVLGGTAPKRVADAL